jgi:hypothetical protein
MNEGEQLRKFMDGQPGSKIDVARSLNMSKQNLFGLFKSKELEPETKKKFEDYYGKSIFTGESKGKVNVSRGTSEKPPGDKLQTLIESNKLLAEANKKLSDAHFLLAEDQRELMRRVATANVPEQSPQDADAIRAALLELVTQVGAGKRWKTAEEVKTVYRKLVSDALAPKKEGDTQKSSDKPHKVK